MSLVGQVLPGMGLYVGGWKVVECGWGVWSVECVQQGLVEVWEWGSGTLVYPSGEGFSTSGVPVSPLFSKSSNSPLSKSFVHGSCSLSHKARRGWFLIVALCSPAAGFSSMGWRYGLAEEPCVFVTCIGDAHGAGTASPVTLVKHLMLFLCHVQWLGSAMSW